MAFDRVVPRRRTRSMILRCMMMDWRILRCISLIVARTSLRARARDANAPARRLAACRRDASTRRLDDDAYGRAAALISAPRLRAAVVADAPRRARAADMLMRAAYAPDAGRPSDWRARASFLCCILRLTLATGRSRYGGMIALQPYGVNRSCAHPMFVVHLWRRSDDQGHGAGVHRRATIGSRPRGASVRIVLESVKRRDESAIGAARARRSSAAPQGAPMNRWRIHPMPGADRTWMDPAPAARAALFPVCAPAPAPATERRTRRRTIDERLRRIAGHPVACAAAAQGGAPYRPAMRIASPRKRRRIRRSSSPKTRRQASPNAFRPIRPQPSVCRPGSAVGEKRGGRQDR